MKVKPLLFVCMISLMVLPLFTSASELSPQYGTVLSAKPIVEVVRDYRPVKVCRETSHKRSPKDNTAGRVVGGIVGAVLGSKLGDKGPEKAVGAVAGAVIGSNIGEAASESTKRSSKQGRVCRMEQRLEEFERKRGYRVTYRYMGQNFETELPYNPGPEIELHVSVEPVIRGPQIDKERGL